MNTNNPKPSCRQQSKAEWSADNTNEDINTGSLQRIADACEKMAVNFDQIHFQLTKAKNELEAYKRRWLDEEKKNQYLKATNTKLRNRLKASVQKGNTNG